MARSMPTLALFQASARDQKAELVWRLGVVWSGLNLVLIALATLPVFVLYAFLERYLVTVADEVTSTVGCYRLEGPGIQLFAAIDGDYFTILGLPLLPLLAELRNLGTLDR